MAIKHSVVMICYNQEEYIRTALDSVLCEKVKPDEIIIGDDCSTDGTRAILEEYRSKYPEIIKLVLNEKNLGIFDNLNNVTPRATGDMIHFLSGDDWYKPNLLQNMNNKIEELSLKPATSKFILLPNMVLHQHDAPERLLRVEAKMLSRYSPVGLALRGMLHTMHVGLSRALFDKWSLFPKDLIEIGPWADYVHHVKLVQHIEKIVVMDCEGPVYRVGVGIGSRITKEELNRSFHAALVRIYSNYLRGELEISDVDARYLEFLIGCWSVSMKFNVGAIAIVCGASWSLLKSAPSETGLVSREILRTVRRLISASCTSKRIKKNNKPL